MKLQSILILNLKRYICNHHSKNDIKNSFISLLSKGLVVTIEDYSFKNLILNKKDELKGASLKAKFNLKKDDDLAKKLKISPLFALKDLDVSVNIKLSKKIYEKLQKTQSKMMIIKKYVKIDKNSVKIDILFNAGKLSINGKSLN